jgi:hypothetical protein
VSISQSSALETRLQPFFQASWPRSERTSTAYFHDHQGVPFLRPSAAGATAAREPSALLSVSIRDPSIPPPLPAYTGALSQTTKNRKVEVRKLLIFQNPKIGVSL